MREGGGSLLKCLFHCISESFLSPLSQVDQAILLCSEMHNIKEAIYENKSKLEGIGEDYQIQVHGAGDTGWCCLSNDGS